MYQAKAKHQQGIALISVLFIAVVVLILASTFIFMITRERQATTSARLVSDALQTADAITERARFEVIQAFRNSYLTAPSFVQQAGIVLGGGSSSIAAINAYAKNAQTATIDGKSGWWKIVAASPIDNVNIPPRIMYIDIAATAETGSGVQTVIRRINMGESKIFDLAMLSEKTDCIYCHLRVNGDVGAIGDLRPGYGIEGGSGHGSGGELGGSVVNGTVFISGKASNDDTNLSGPPKKINGAIFSDIQQDYSGNRLPKDEDGDGIPDFPVIKREVGEMNTNGTISGGTIYTIAPNTTLSSLPTGTVSSITNGKYIGNVILEGTKDNPLVIDGDFYVSGDVIIKGYVKGRGAIYSGKNTYIAGNLIYDNPPPNCATASNPDSCAQTAISNNKDELRIASRGNIILGDYTEYNADGSQKVWQELQAADFFRSQFGFFNCYNKSNGDELRSKAGSFFDVDGDVIANADVVCPTDKYSYSMRPGRINADGTFNTWLSDGLYKQLLGTEQRSYDLWRYEVQQSSLTEEMVRKQFAKYNLSDPSINDILTNGTGSFDISDTTGNVIGTVHWDDGLTIRVMIDTAFNYEKQVTRVDAFLYANQRIAGKTFNAPLVINGGMIGKEIGVLAPGIEKPWWLNQPRYDFMATPNNITHPKNCGDANYIKKFTDGIDLNHDGVVNSQDKPELSPLYQPDSIDCALTINYDYRLRNGGLGFNLVSSEVGQTLTWQIADKANQQVRP